MGKDEVFASRQSGAAASWGRSFAPVRRTLLFARFTLTEYVRSGRVLVEVVALLAVTWMFFWPRGSQGMALDQFFNQAGLFIFALTAYTTAIVMGLGRRPQGYVVLARSLGRSGYLLGLYLAALTVSFGGYFLLSVIVPLLNVAKGQPQNITLSQWGLGSLPLLLDVLILSSFVMLITPLVMSAWPRLVMIALFVVAVTTDFGVLEGLDNIAVGVLKTLVGLVLLPAAGGFELAIQRNYTPDSLWLLLAQAVLAAAIVALSLISFKRRELILIS